MPMSASAGPSPTAPPSPTRRSPAPDFARTFLAPLQPADLFGLMLAGDPARTWCWAWACTRSAATTTSGPPRRPHPRPTRLRGGAGAAARAAAQRPAAVRLAVQDQQRIAWLKLERRRSEDRASERRLRELLALPADRHVPRSSTRWPQARPGQIAIRTRSLIEVLGQLAADIDVRAGDVTDGRTYAAPPDASATRFPRIAVRHGLLEPRDAFASVRYDGDWFWIDERRPAHQARVQLRHAAAVPEREQPAGPAAGDLASRPAEPQASGQRQHHVRRGSAARACSRAR